MRAHGNNISMFSFYYDSMLLQVKNVTKRFGGLEALNNVTLHIDQGEIVGLIGPNGSGKTTLFNCISGILKIDAGSIAFNGERIDNMRPHEIPRRGIARTFQLVNLFEDLTVLRNVILAYQSNYDRYFRNTFQRYPQEVEKKAIQLLELVDLVHLKDEPAGDTSYGQQKLLEIAIVLMSDPKLLLADEPTAGINPTLIERIKDHMRQLRNEGLTIFIIEHNMNVVMDLCDRVYVLNEGAKIAEGKPREIKTNKAVLEAYFGG